MTVAQMMEMLRGKLDDPRGDVYDDARVRRLLEEGYRKVILDLERLGQNIGIAANPVEVSVTSSQREYALSPTENRIRRIVDVARTDLSAPVPVRWTTFTGRNSFVSVPSLTRWHQRGVRVYLYLRGDGLWVLGLTDPTPQTMTLSVWYMPHAEPLSEPSRGPLLVNDEAHDLIVYWAAVCAKIEENRDAASLADQYRNMLDNIMATTGSFALRTQPATR